MIKTWAVLRLQSNGQSVVADLTQRLPARLHAGKILNSAITAIKLVIMLVSAIAEEHQGHPDHVHLDHLPMNAVIDVIDAAVETSTKEVDLDLQEEIEIPTVHVNQVPVIEALEKIGIDIITIEDAIAKTDTDLEADLLLLETIRVQICAVMIVIDAKEMVIKTIEEIDMRDLI